MFIIHFILKTRKKNKRNSAETLISPVLENTDNFFGIKREFDSMKSLYTGAPSVQQQL